MLINVMFTKKMFDRVLNMFVSYHCTKNKFSIKDFFTFCVVVWLFIISGKFKHKIKKT